MRGWESDEEEWDRDSLVSQEHGKTYHTTLGERKLKSGLTTRATGAVPAGVATRGLTR